MTRSYPAYTERRRQLIDRRRARPHVTSGLPAGRDTVYLSVVDSAGNACSFINSLFMGTGSGLVVPGTGVALHNRASLFSLDPAHANALAPGKRPYQTIIPALTTRQGELHACFGVMGGYMQPQGHLQVLSHLVDRGLSPQAALDQPRWQLADPGGAVGAVDPGGVVLVEDAWDTATLRALAGRGHRLQVVSGLARSVFGGGQVIVRDAQTGVLIGGSDGRKDGCAMGW
jgi:gamma-glutamyltranspeptidase/glutathione hydrolase